MKPIANMLLPEKRPFDNVHMDMNNPQEEEFGMVNLQPGSLYNFFLFPGDFDDIINYEMNTELFIENDLKSWKNEYRRLIAKAMLNTCGERFISNNPCNIARIQLLSKMFPNAKLIFIFRNPYEGVVGVVLIDSFTPYSLAHSFSQ